MPLLISTKNQPDQQAALETVRRDAPEAKAVDVIGCDAPGGISLLGLSLNDYNKLTSLSQSDRSSRFVEPTRQGSSIGTGFSAGRGLCNGFGFDDDHARSVSTAFAS
ncbi:hypothetical protein NX059_012209 [Plenodomus lindquistii]|nr:hypothetical protein NX059_012209 [Plenodomus lindquistii]